MLNVIYISIRVPQYNWLLTVWAADLLQHGDYLVCIGTFFFGFRSVIFVHFKVKFFAAMQTVRVS